MTKYERINRAKLTDKGKAVYDKLFKATKGFTDKDSIKKNKAVLDKFYDRVKDGLPEAIKPAKTTKSKAKPKAKAKKPAYKNVNMGNFAKETSALAKKEGISYKEAQKKMSAIFKERKAKAQKKQGSDFDKMIAGLKKKVEYRGGRGLGDVKERGKMRKVDLKKDAKLDALDFGKRTSKGTGANQYGKAKKGRTYYEYRNNRADVKNAPPSQPYPKLAKGGKLSEYGYFKSKAKEESKAGYVVHVNVLLDKDGDISLELSDFYNTNETIATYENGKTLLETNFDSKQDMLEWIDDNKDYAKGGRVKDVDRFGITIVQDITYENQYGYDETYENTTYETRFKTEKEANDRADEIEKEDEKRVYDIYEYKIPSKVVEAWNKLRLEDEDFCEGLDDFFEENYDDYAKGGELRAQTITIKFKDNSDALRGKQLLEDYYIDFGEIDNYGDELDLVATNPSFQYLEYIRAALEGTQEKIEISSYAKGGKTKENILYSKDLKRGDGWREREFQVLERDTKGMRGSQDKYSMRVVETWGSHPSLEGAKKYANNNIKAKGGNIKRNRRKGDIDNRDKKIKVDTIKGDRVVEQATYFNNEITFKDISVETAKKMIESNFDKKNYQINIAGNYPERISAQLFKKNDDGSKEFYMTWIEKTIRAKGGMTKEIENDFNMPKFLKDQIIDKDGKRKIDDKSIEMLTDYTNNVMPQTKDAYFKDGKYTKERQKLHKQIIDEFKGDLVCIQQDEPIAILMGGSPASGKSTFLRKYAPYLLDDEILRIDADETRSRLPEYDGWNASATHLETKDIVNTLLSDRTIGLPCEYDIIYDGTMNNTKAYLPLIKLLRKLGYKIYVVYVDNVPKSVIEKRVKERYQKSGRFVPLEVVDDFFSKGKTALNEIKKKVDGYMVIDGSDSNYKILEEGGMKLPKSRKYSQIGTAIDKMATGGEVFSEQIARGYDVNINSGVGTYAKGGRTFKDSKSIKFKVGSVKEITLSTKILDEFDIPYEVGVDEIRVEKDDYLVAVDYLKGGNNKNIDLSNVITSVGSTYAKGGDVELKEISTPQLYSILKLKFTQSIQTNTDYKVGNDVYYIRDGFGSKRLDDDKLYLYKKTKGGNDLIGVLTTTYAKGGITIEGNPYKNEDFFIYRDGKEVVSWSADELMEDDYSQDTAQEMFDLYNNDKKGLSYRLENLNYAKGGKTKKMKKDDNWIQGVDKEMERKGTKGAFTKQAKRAGMSTVAFAKEVLRSPDKYSEKTRERAQFMKNVNPELFEYGGKISEAGDVDFPEKLLGYAKGGNVDSFSHEIARGFDVNLKSGTGTYAVGGRLTEDSLNQAKGIKVKKLEYMKDQEGSYYISLYLDDDSSYIFYSNGRVIGRYIPKDYLDGGSERLLSALSIDYAKGGKTQGYNARLDESLAMRDGSKLTKKVKYKGRRDESKGMEKAMGKRAYSSVDTMDDAMLDLENFYAKGGEIEEEEVQYGSWYVEISEDENDEEIRNQEVARLIRGGYMSGFEPTWSLEITDIDGDIDEATENEIARLVEDGYTSGEVVMYKDNYAKGGNIKRNKRKYDLDNRDKIAVDTRGGDRAVRFILYNDRKGSKRYQEEVRNEIVSIEDALDTLKYYKSDDKYDVNTRYNPKDRILVRVTPKGDDYTVVADLREIKLASKGGKVDSKELKQLLKDGFVIDYANEEDYYVANVGYRQFRSSGNKEFYIYFNGTYIHISKTFGSLERKLNQIINKYDLEYEGINEDLSDVYAKGGKTDTYVTITLAPKKTAYKGGKAEVYKNMEAFYDTINSNEDKYPFVHYLSIMDSRQSDPTDISEVRVYMVGEKSGFDKVEKKGLYDLFDLKKSSEKVKKYAKGGKIEKPYQVYNSITNNVEGYFDNEFEAEDFANQFEDAEVYDLRLMAKGGKTQGYNSRLDESLAMRRGNAKTKKQSKKDRRDESKAMEKAKGKRAYSSVKTMDKKVKYRGKK